MDETQRHPLETLRKERGWTQQQLADRSSVSRRTISYVENRRVLPQRAIRTLLLRALRQPIDEHESVFGPLPRPGRKPRAAEATTHPQ